MDLKKKITYLKKKYETNNPYVIAQGLGIKIIFEDLALEAGTKRKAE